LSFAVAFVKRKTPRVSGSRGFDFKVKCASKRAYRSRICAFKKVKVKVKVKAKAEAASGRAESSRARRGRILEKRFLNFGFHDFF